MILILHFYLMVLDLQLMVCKWIYWDLL